MAEEIYGGGGGGANLTAAQTVQTQNCVDMTLAGNSTSAGAGFALVSSGTLTLAGGPNITLSQDGNHVTVIGGAGGAFSGGISTGGNTAGTSGTVGNGLLFFGGNSITLSGSTAAGGATLSVIGPSAWSQSGGMSNVGNTSGTTGIASGSAVRMIFAGGNNITLSQSLNGASGTITISAASQTLQTSNLFDLTLSGNTSGVMALVSSGTLSLAGGNNITLSQAGNAVTISAFTQSAESQSMGMSNIGNTSGTTGIASGAQVRYLFAGGNNITLSQSLNGASGTVTISAGNAIAFTGGVSTGGNTAGTTGTVNSGILFVGGQNITLSQSSAAGGATITISGSSSGGQGVSTGGNTLGTTGTVDFRMIFVGGNNITLSQSANGGSGTITISAPNLQTAISGIQGSGTSVVTNGTVQFANSNNITFGLNGSTMTASFSETQTVAPIATAVNNVLSAASTGTITRFAPEDHAHAGVFSIGISAGVGNTSGSTGVLPGRMIFAGGNNITLSQSTSAGNLMTLTISGPNAQTGISGIAASGASTATSGTVQFANSNGVTFGLNGNTITASYSQSVPPLSSRFVWLPDGASTASQQVNSNASFQYIQIPYDISFTRIDIPLLLSLASSATTNTGNIVISSGLVIYSQVSAPALQLNPITGSFGTTTYTWASNSANFSSISGARLATFGIATTLAAGNYHVGVQFSTANTSSIGLSTTQYGNTMSMLLGAEFTDSQFRDFGGTGVPSVDIIRGKGVLAATITATNQTIQVTDIVGTAGSKIQGNFWVGFRAF